MTQGLKRKMKKRKIFKNKELQKMKGRKVTMTMGEFMKRGYINADDVYCREGHANDSFGFINAIFSHRIHGDMMKFHGDTVVNIWKPIVIGKVLYNALKSYEYYDKLGLIKSNPAIVNDSLFKAVV
jgi:hypothetical protein